MTSAPRASALRLGVSLGTVRKTQAVQREHEIVMFAAAQLAIDRYGLFEQRQGSVNVSASSSMRPRLLRIAETSGWTLPYSFRRSARLAIVRRGTCRIPAK